MWSPQELSSTSQFHHGELKSGLLISNCELDGWTVASPSVELLVIAELVHVRLCHLTTNRDTN